MIFAGRCGPAQEERTQAMKTLIAGALTAILMGTAAAEAAPFYGPMAVPRFAPVVVRPVMRPSMWVRGARFMPASGRYVTIADWRPYSLRRPQFGFHWVRVGGDFLLINN